MRFGLAIQQNFIELMISRNEWMSSFYEDSLKQTIAEGGGVNIFSTGVQYAIQDLGKDKMVKTQEKIKNIVSKRETLKKEMEIWYRDVSKGTYPKTFELVALDEELSVLDTKYKQMWDLRQDFAK